MYHRHVWRYEGYVDITQFMCRDSESTAVVIKGKRGEKGEDRRWNLEFGTWNLDHWMSVMMYDIIDMYNHTIDDDKNTRTPTYHIISYHSLHRHIIDLRPYWCCPPKLLFGTRIRWYHDTNTVLPFLLFSFSAPMMNHDYSPSRYGEREMQSVIDQYDQYDQYDQIRKLKREHESGTVVAMFPL